MGGYFQLASSAALVDPATGTSPWVDYGAQQFYNQLRMQSQPTVGPFTFTAAAGAGPYTISANQLQIQSATGVLFTNVNGFTIPAGSGISSTVTAINPGSAGNIANGTSLTLTTSLPGVSIQTNPASGPTPWYAAGQAGSNIESDASLIARCLNQWVAMGTGSPIGAYINWAFAASNEVRYVNVLPTGVGSVNVYVYGDGGQVSTAGLIAIQRYVSARMPTCSFIAPGYTSVPGAIPSQGMPIGASPLNINPVGQTNFSAVLYGPSTAQTAGLAAAAAALQLLVQGTPVGGYPIAPGTPDTYGIANSDFVTAIQQSNSAITKVVVSVHNGSGSIAPGDAGNDLIMAPDLGVPRIAQVPPAPSLPGSWSLTWTSV
jgi:hypothetical protein